MIRKSIISIVLKAILKGSSRIISLVIGENFKLYSWHFHHLNKSVFHKTQFKNFNHHKLISFFD